MTCLLRHTSDIQQASTVMILIIADDGNQSLMCSCRCSFRSKVEAELASALADLEKQKEETLAGLESQVQALSEEIIKKVLPIPLPAKR